MAEYPRDERTENRTTEASAPSRPARPAMPALQALDLGTGAGIGMVCDIDDPDCNPMEFAGTSGAPSMTGEGGEGGEG